MDNQSEANVAQPSPTNPIAESPIPQETSKKNNLKIWLIALVIIFVIAGAGAYYSLHKSMSVPYASKNSSLPTAAITTMPTTTNNSLSPNTGNLYSDIKTKLDQVIK